MYCMKNFSVLPSILNITSYMCTVLQGNRNTYLQYVLTLYYVYYCIYLGTRDFGFYFSENSGGFNRVLFFPIKFMHFSAVDCRLHKKSGVFRLCWPLTVVYHYRLYCLKVVSLSSIDCHSHHGASFLPIFSSTYTRSSLLSRLLLSFTCKNLWNKATQGKIQASFRLKLYFPETPKFHRD